jgi:hypothetical protein
MKPNQVLDDLLVKDVTDGLSRQRLVKSKFGVTADAWSLPPPTTPTDSAAAQTVSWVLS